LVSGEKVLWLCSRDSMFDNILKDRREPTSLLMTKPKDPAASGDFFDACLCELSPSVLTMLPALHPRIPPLVRSGRKILFHINNPYLTPVGMGQFAAYEAVFPDVDKSGIRFYGTWFTAQIRNLYLRAATFFPAESLARGILAGLALVAFAPMAWVPATRRGGPAP